MEALSAPALLRAAWAKPGKLKLSLGQFEASLAAGVCPWHASQGKAGLRTLLGALCRSHHCDLSQMLASWVRHVEDINHPPKGHPEVLCCMPLDGSVSAWDRLVASGADASSKAPAIAFFQKALDEPSALETENFWALANGMLVASATRLVDLAEPLGHTPSSLFRVFSSKALPQAGFEAMFTHGGWDFDWSRNDVDGKRMCDWLCQVVSMKDVPPSALTQAGVRWTDRTAEGNTLAHCISIDVRYSYTGDQILPVEGLIEAMEQGLTLEEENNQGWTVLQRIGGVRWANEGEIERLLTFVRAQQLQKDTTPSPARSSSPRL